MQAFRVKWFGAVTPAPGATFRRPGGPAILPDGPPRVDPVGATVYTFLDSLRPYETIEVFSPHYYTVTTSTGPPVQLDTPTANLVYVGLSHQWPYALAWAELENGSLLDDGDVIRADIRPGTVPAEVVEFRITSMLWWWKEINVPDGETGSSWNIHTGAVWGGARRFEDTVGLWTHQVRNGQRLSFRKAKTAGLVSTTYVLGGLERLAGGTRVTFDWVRE
ncbi:hypothetical protein [Amycolatopsis balhimycina]|uniref:hypothetical protein n=1 Tax=Amycolatopsis balhimycina TaxID=208443 RepID=UPI0003A1DC13|nr:hypothetical protein [Amycolatopsis balhimycina]